jgi:pimeloyl-ACP methyl ester carboxylesterase
VTYVLIPGAGGEAWYWHRVVPLLRERGHDVVAPDLPAADENAGLREYAEAVVRAAADRRDLTVVAQSLGAFTAPLLCEPLDVTRIVLVAPMIPAPGQSPGEWMSAAGPPPVPFDAMTSFFHDVPEDVVAEAVARGEPPQADRPFADPWPLDAWPDVPTRVLAARDDRLFPFAFQALVAKARLGLDVEAIPGGHLAALSHPVALVDRLLAPPA